MATTIVPAFDQPIDPNLNLEDLRSELKEFLDSAQGDSDKAGEVEAVCWYDGQVSILLHVLCRLTGTTLEDNN